MLRNTSISALQKRQSMGSLDRRISRIRDRSDDLGHRCRSCWECKVLGDLLQDAVRYSSQQAYNAALKSAISEIPHGSEGGPSSTYVLLSGTNSYVPRVNSNLHIIENPDFIVYRGHSAGDHVQGRCIRSTRTFQF